MGHAATFAVNTALATGKHRGDFPLHQSITEHEAGQTDCKHRRLIGVKGLGSNPGYQHLWHTVYPLGHLAGQIQADITGKLKNNTRIL